jgi:hypothetical protein
MTRVFWTPRTNTQRSALARFGTDWQINKDLSWPRTVNGNKCLFVHPVGHPQESRWVRVEQIEVQTA